LHVTRPRPYAAVDTWTDNIEDLHDMWPTSSGLVYLLLS
jgi:hypothetical protein